MSGLCRIGILAFLLSAVAIVNAGPLKYNASLGGRSTTNNQQPSTTTKQQQRNNNNQPQQQNNNNESTTTTNNNKTTTKKGTQEVRIKTVTLKLRNADYGGNGDLSVKLEPKPNPNGKSCKIKFGNMERNTAKTQNAPISCEFGLTTTSQIRVHVVSPTADEFKVDTVKVTTTNGGFDVQFPDRWFKEITTGEEITRMGQ